MAHVPHTIVQLINYDNGEASFRNNKSVSREEANDMCPFLTYRYINPLSFSRMFCRTDIKAPAIMTKVLQPTGFATSISVRRANSATFNPF